MPTVIVRYQTKAEAAEENQRLVERVFADLASRRPEGLRYVAFRLADEVTFVHLAVVDGERNPLPELPAFQEFQREIGDRTVAPPAPEGATLVGSYGFPLER